MNALSFLQTPWYWFLALMLPLLVVFYLLKLKRKRVMMPSTLLWRRSVQDLIANAPFQKLRNNLLLWLQLLLLAMLILGFMRPTMKLKDMGGTTIVLLIDNSASMQAIEAGGVTRIEQARQRARSIIDNMSNKDEAIVIAFSDRTSVVQTLTSDQALLRLAMSTIKPRDVETSLREAGLILQGLTTTVDAEGVRQPRENTRTIIFSDGLMRDLAALRDIPNVEFVKIGESSDNVGITALDVRESFANTFEYQIFASVTNSSDVERQAFVEFQVDGEVIDLKSTVIAPGETEGIVFTTSEALDGIATLKLDKEDALPLDNLVRAQMAPPSEINVLLVSSDNYFLEQVFSVDPRVRVSVIRPTDYSARAEYDIVVFDNATAGELPPGNFIFINSLPPIPGFAKAGDDIANPQIIDWNRVHPLTRFADFEEVLVGKALNYDAPPSAIPIVESLQANLITLYESENQHVLVIGFDIFKSFWPVDVSFPIFMSNLIDYFGRVGAGTYQPAYATGSTIPIYPEKDASKATVTMPSGTKRDFSFEGVSTAYLTETNEAGIYTIDFDNGTKVLLPVNLFSESESLITPAEEIDLEGRSIAGTTEALRTNQEIWHWLVLAALGVLLVEWLIYTRRTFM